MCLFVVQHLNYNYPKFEVSLQCQVEPSSSDMSSSLCNSLQEEHYKLSPSQKMDSKVSLWKLIGVVSNIYVARMGDPQAERISSVSQSCLTRCDPMECSMPDFPAFTISQSLLKLMSIESVMPSNHLILCCPLLLLLSVFPSIRVFFSESVLHIRWPKYWSFSLSISPTNEYSGLISFRMDWFDFLVVQGTLKSLLQHHSSKASILRHSVFLWSYSHIHT